MKKKTIAIAITLVGFILVGGVAACKHGHPAGGFDEFDWAAAVNRIASRLDLTASQKADLKVMADEIAEKANAMHAEHEYRRQELADLIREDTIDRDLVDARIAEKIEQMHAMADFVADRIIVFHSTLTPDQRERIATRVENHSSKRCRFGFR